MFLRFSGYKSGETAGKMPRKLGGTVGICIDIVGKLVKKWIILAPNYPPKNLRKIGGFIYDLYIDVRN